MNPIVGLLVIVLVAGVAIVAFAAFAPRRVREPRVAPQGPALRTTTDWTHEAGDEFAGLSESARCDLVFAVAALEDDRSQRLLEHALDDPAEPVALAAAHVLAGSGRRGMVERYLSDHPGQRADRIAQTLSLLDLR